MWSINLTDGKPDQNVYVAGDTLDLLAEIENRSDQGIKIKLNLSMSVNGVAADPDWLPVDAEHDVGPGETKRMVALQGLRIDMALGLDPGRYQFYLVASDVDNPHDTCHDAIPLYIEPRTLYADGYRLVKNGVTQEQWMIWGGYNLFCRGQTETHENPDYSIQMIKDNFDALKTYWPGALGIRLWMISGQPQYQHLWRKHGNQFNLDEPNLAHEQRFVDTLDACEEYDVTPTVDVYDHYMMAYYWQTHPLHPLNNSQRLFGFPQNEDNPMQEWYNLAKYPELAQWQKRYVQRVASLCSGYDCIISTGNEMVEGDPAMRRNWHIQTAKWIREANKYALITENDLTTAHGTHANPIFDLLDIHSLGNIRCQGDDGFTGEINEGAFNLHGKPVFYNTDGLWQCRYKEHVIKAMFNEVQLHGMGHMGHKAPALYDDLWSTLGKPIIEWMGQQI